MSLGGNSPYQRWYDRDPALSRALEHLRQASDTYQAQVALNIIQIIVEHQAETEHGEPLEPLAQEGFCEDGTTEHQREKRRWYDVNATLRSAMQLLRDCPEDLQKSVIPSIIRMIEHTLDESAL